MATFNVTSSDDSGKGSLREAINFANANLGEDDIYLQTNVTLIQSIEISDSVSLGTPFGATITQTGNERIFYINDDTENAIDVSLFRLNMSGGNSDLGGAIFSRENLSLVDSEVFGNTAKQGAGIYQMGGSLSIERTRIYDNRINSDSEEIGGVFSDIEPDLINAVVDIESAALEETEEKFVLDNMDIIEVHHFYESEKKHHLYTADSNEIAQLSIQIERDNLPYNPSSKRFNALASNIDTLTGAKIEPAHPVYRFFHRDTGAHFYTLDRVEKNYIQENLDNYSFEDIEFYAFETKPENILTIPVYRFFHNSGTHLFTIDNTEIQNSDEFLRGGDDDIAFYVFEQTI